MSPESGHRFPENDMRENRLQACRPVRLDASRFGAGEDSGSARAGLAQSFCVPAPDKRTTRD